MSMSGEKLETICNCIRNKILEDDTLKSRVKKIEITWETLESSNDAIFVPNLEIEFKD